MFIVIDGLDGSGKSTQAKLLCKKITQRGKSYILRAHPSEDNFFGRLGRGYLLVDSHKAKIAASLFYMLDVVRSIIVYGWRKADYLVFIRYLMGTAYLPLPFHKLAYLFFYALVPRSNYMFFIDVSPEEAHRRIEKRPEGIKEVFESLEKLKEVREKAKSLVSSGGWIVLNGDEPWQVIHGRIAGFVGL